MPRRRDRVAPPPRPGEWDVRFEDNASAKGWEQVSRDSPSSARAAWEALAAEPRRRRGRQHRLKGPPRVDRVNGVEMEQWQYEVTGSGRIWYCIDDQKKTVWLTRVSVGHPKATE